MLVELVLNQQSPATLLRTMQRQRQPACRLMELCKEQRPFEDCNDLNLVSIQHSTRLSKRPGGHGHRPDSN